MFDKIPDHIRYPGMVVALLTMTVVSQVILFKSATGGRGLQIEPDYYSKAIKWDEDVALRRKSEALGWKVKLAVKPSDSPSQRLVEISLRDADGAPVEGAAGTVDLRRPELIKGDQKPLATVPGRPGVYRFSAEIARAGLWDLSLDLKRGDDRFVQKIRHEIR